MSIFGAPDTLPESDLPPKESCISRFLAYVDKLAFDRANNPLVTLKINPEHRYACQTAMHFPGEILIIECYRVAYDQTSLEAMSLSDRSWMRQIGSGGVGFNADDGLEAGIQAAVNRNRAYQFEASEYPNEWDW